MSSVWFADISMESLPGPRPVRPTVSLRPSMACFRQQSARLVDMHALKPCARSCFSLPENLTSPRSTRMPAEPHYPLSFQKSHNLRSIMPKKRKRILNKPLVIQNEQIVSLYFDARGVQSTMLLHD